MENTIKELIEKLQKIEDKDLIVHLEGCDCYGEWNGKITIDKNNYLLLERID